MSSEPGDRQRLHPLGVVVLALARVRGWASALLPLAVAVAVSVGVLAVAGVAVVAGLAAAAVGLLEWRALTFGVEHSSFVLRRGLLGRETVSVPLSRIQSVEVEQSPVARMLGVRALALRTAAGTADLRLAAVSAEVEVALRRALGDEGTAPEAGEEVIRALPARSLALMALTSPRIGAGVGVLYAVLLRVDEVVPGDLSGRIAPVLAPRSLAAALVLAGVAAVVAAGASLVGTTLTWAGFRVVRDGPRLRLRRGLLSLRETVVPLDRARAVEVREGLPREAVGLCSLTVLTGGRGTEGEQRGVLFPLLPMDESAALVRDAVPALDLEGVALRTPPPRARMRAALRLALPVAVLAAAPAVLLAPVGLLVALLVPLAGALGLAQWRTAGLGLHEGRLRWRRREVARRTTIAQARTVQWRRVRQGPWQRRRGLATLEVGLAVGATKARVRDLEVAEAAGLARALAP